MHLIIAVFCLSILLPIANSLRFVKEADFDDVRLGKEGYDRVKTLHYNWYLHGIKAIMGQLGRDLWKKLDRESKHKFYVCLDKIPDRRDIVASAQCLMTAREAYLTLLKNNRQTGTVSSLPIFPAKQVIEQPGSFAVASEPKPRPIFPTKQVGSLTVEVLPRPVYDYRYPANPLESPTLKLFPEVWNMRRLKRLRWNSSVNNRNFLRRVKRSPYRLVTDTVSKSDGFSRGFMVKTMEKAPSLKKVEKTPVQRITGLVKTLAGINETQGTWSASYDNILTIKKAMDKRAKDPGAKVYDMRMLDLVLDRDHATAGDNDKTLMPPLVQEAYDLISTFDKTPKAFSDGKNIKFLSPRFAPVMPDKTEVRGKLSPSVLSFYNDDSEDQIVPIPKLLEATGMSASDREIILETVMELSGARESVDKAMKVLEKMNLFGMEGELKEVTEKVAKYFQELEKSFSRRQQKEMKRRGFTFLETNQIEELYTKQGIRNHDELPIDIEEYKTMTRKDKEHSLWLRIEQIASNMTDEEHARKKRQISWVNVLKPTVLAPYMFTPIYGLSVLGPTVLSPSLFSPLILNPAVLSPYVLSPAVGMPFILSPYLLSPYVLSPLVMAPFILTPYVLSPNVINPYVLSPLILSPLVLCPDVLSPMVLGGGILSPGVASPSILSKSVLMASVLSPSVLS